MFAPNVKNVLSSIYDPMPAGVLSQRKEKKIQSKKGSKKKWTISDEQYYISWSLLLVRYDDDKSDI